MRIHVLIFILVIFTKQLAAEKLPFTNKDTTKAFSWNISDIYKNWSDWESDLNYLETNAGKLNDYKGKVINNYFNLIKLLKIKDELSVIASKLYSFVSLQKSIDVRNQEYSNRQQQLTAALNKIYQKTGWLDSELASINSDSVEKWALFSKDIQIYKHYLKQYSEEKNHVLPEAENNLISLMEIPLSGSLKIYNALSVADMKFDSAYLSDDTWINASFSNLDKILYNNSNADDRRKVAEANLKSFAKNKFTYSEIYINTVQARWATAQALKYSSCLDYILSNNKIPKDVYLNLTKITEKNTAPLQKYLSIRKKYLQLPYLYPSDLNVSLANFSKNYSYKEAIELITKALSPLGLEYQNSITLAFENRWIDVYPKSGKRTGAFSSNVYGVHPYILLNYSETQSNLLTLIHELGHAMHSVISSKNQPYIYHEATEIVAEIASTFNEQLLIDYLITNAQTPAEKINYLTLAIDNLIVKFYRAGELANFEYQIHSMIEKDEPVNSEIMAQIFEQLEKNLYGKEISFFKESKYAWMRTHHFFTKYYYLYSYAISYTASLNLFKNIKNETNSQKNLQYKNQYMQLLKSGSSDYPIELIKRAGVNLTDEAPYLQVIRQLDNWITELENELKKTGKI